MKLNSRLVENIRILELNGSFDAANGFEARQWIKDAISNSPSNIIVNLKGVHFIESAGLTVLVQGRKRAQANGGDLRLCCMQQPVRLVFEMTRLDKIFEIFNNESEAVDAFRVSA